MCVSLWCDGREADATDKEMLECPSKKIAREKHKKGTGGRNIFTAERGSGPQLHFWARMIVAKNTPPNVPMITGFAA